MRKSQRDVILQRNHLHEKEVGRIRRVGCKECERLDDECSKDGGKEASLRLSLSNIYAYLAGKKPYKDQQDVKSTIPPIYSDRVHFGCLMHVDPPNTGVLAHLLSQLIRGIIVVVCKNLMPFCSGVKIGWYVDTIGNLPSMTLARSFLLFR